MLLLIPLISYIVFVFFFFLIWFSVCCPNWVIFITLSSKSLICSSSLFILLFNVFSSVFISANDFPNYFCLLIVSISFLKSSALLLMSTQFLQYFHYLLFLTWCLLDWRGLFHCLLLQGNSPVLLIVSGSWASSFCLYFSNSVSLGKTTIYCGLGGLFIQGSILGFLWGLFLFVLVWRLLLVWMLAVSFLCGCRLLCPWLGVCWYVACFQGDGTESVASTWLLGPW